MLEGWSVEHVPGGVEAWRLLSPPYPPITLDAGLAFRSRRLAAALSYWEAIRRDREMPVRGDLDPAGMVAFLSDIVLIDVVEAPGAGRRYVVRLFGGEAKEMVAGLRRDDIESFLDPHVAARWRWTYDQCVERRRPIRASGTLIAEDKTHYGYEVLIAPLAPSGTEERKPALVLLVVGRVHRRSEADLPA